MTERGDKQAIEFVMQQIENSGQPTAEVQHVLGALSLWKAAHGDFDLPESTAQESPIANETPDNLPAHLEDVTFGNAELRTNVTDAEQLANIQELHATVTGILLPYVNETQTIVQRAGSERDRKGNLPQIDHYRWHDTQLVGNSMANVFFEIPFKPSGVGYNEALGLNITYTYNKKPNKRDVQIRLAFKDGGVDTLTVQNGREASFAYEPPRDMLRNIISQGPLNDSYLPVKDRWSLSDDYRQWEEELLAKHAGLFAVDHTFYLQEFHMRIESISHITGQLNKFSFRRLFNPSLNKFNSIKSSPNVPNKIYEGAMEISHVTDFIEGLMASLPRMDK